MQKKLLKDLRFKMADKGNFILFYILLIAILITCIFVAVYVMKHKEIYENEPLVYGARQYDVDVCYCYTNDGKTFEISQEFVTRKIEASSPFEKIEEINIGE